jgi:DNA-binding response OmpR family regulator
MKVVGSPSATPSYVTGSARCCSAASLRRGTRITPVGEVRTDHAARHLRIGETPVKVSGKEYALLGHLAADPARVFTKEEQLRDAWGFRLPARTRTPTATPPACATSWGRR